MHLLYFRLLTSPVSSLNGLPKKHSLLFDLLMMIPPEGQEEEDAAAIFSSTVILLLALNHSES